MNIGEMKAKSPEELNVELIKLREAQFKLRMQKSTGQLAQTHLLSDNKKEIARVKTVLQQKASN